ncbi:MAG: serine hydrolase domain-containing protein [Sphingomicrobium sp.]
MKPVHKIGLGLGALAVAAAVLAMKPQAPALDGGSPVAAAHMRLAAIAPAARRDVDYARLDARLQQLIAKPGMVGLAVGVVENGRITFLKGYGETRAGSGEPVTPDTVFRWASVSKGVAATMVAKLAQQGKIDLNAPVANYAADLKLPNSNEYRATVGDLLSHRLGLYRNAYDNKLEEGMDPSMLRRGLVQLNAICPPGTCWSYQNVAYDASSEMVSKVTGLPYSVALQRALFDPLGMVHASASMDGLMANDSWARPHGAGRKELPMVETYYKVPAAGGINSNIKDMSLWMMAQMGEMPDVLNGKLLATIHAPYVKTPTERGRLRAYLERLAGAWYGYGWRSYDYAGHRLVGHRGGINGYRSLILFDPARRSGVVALWNSNAPQPGGLEFEVVDQLYHLEFRDWLKLDSQAPSMPIAQTDDSVSQGTN